MPRPQPGRPVRILPDVTALQMIPSGIYPAVI